MAARVLFLYRHLLRLAKDWPVDDRRPGRVMQPHLVEKTKEAFRRNRSVTNRESVEALVSEVGACVLAMISLSCSRPRAG